jgi:hypothetical protein
LAAALDRFVGWVDAKTEDRMSAQRQRHSYYVYYFADNGRNVTQW